MINIYNSHNAPGPGDRKKSQENQPRRIQPTNIKMREPMGAKSRRNNKAFTDTPRKKQEAEPTRTVVAPMNVPSGESDSGNAKDPLEAKRERMLRRGRELDAQTFRTVGRGLRRGLKKSFRDISKSKPPEALGGDVSSGRGTGRDRG